MINETIAYLSNLILLSINTHLSATLFKNHFPSILHKIKVLSCTFYRLQLFEKLIKIKDTGKGDRDVTWKKSRGGGWGKVQLHYALALLKFLDDLNTINNMTKITWRETMRQVLVCRVTVLFTYWLLIQYLRLRFA